ncbi:hypothetical protein [Methanococcoides seepicolus]|uniref:Uncharacterized protein n=1 Tax=Methanococcoides seepicolus TaxID=2828780 RepID=A0A9E4ZGR5_9EURY|nr:hypothetical protein [Methanococcoides seepicolus]MCM1986888.1 hypothetical protein [Methanococcoides seepicolus]
MTKYLVESPHTSEGCLKALDEMLAMGADVLEQYDFGCMVDVHKGWVILEAENESEALKIVPESLRSKARAVALNKFTPEQIKEAHDE